MGSINMSGVLTRFAPSPTGYLHLGHVVNAIYVWGLAGALEGRVLLRIEDHDRIRSRADFEAALLEDLDWLGFVPDEGRHPVLRQSDHDAAFRDALDRLRATHHVYACECSRKDIRLRAERFGGQVGDDFYDGRCRTKGLEERPGRGIRVQMPSEEEQGDLLLRDRDGHWTYQFAVTVDDLRQGITHVIRGEDLQSSTGRQITLARMLGRTTPPSFLHHPLIMKTPTEKLSKAAGDSGVRELRAAGATAADVIGRAAAAVGLTPAARPIAAHEVSDLFQGSVLRRTYSP